MLGRGPESTGLHRLPTPSEPKTLCLRQFGSAARLVSLLDRPDIAKAVVGLKL